MRASLTSRRPTPAEVAAIVAIPLAAAGVALLIFRLTRRTVDLPYWGSIHGDGIRVYPPAGIYEGWDTVQFEPFSGGRIGVTELVLAVVGYGSTLVIGERLLRVLVARFEWPLALRLGGAFLIGYLPVVAMVRLVTLRFSTDVAPVLCLTLMGASAVVSLRVDLRRHGWPDLRAAARCALGIPVVVVTSFGAIVVWTVQSGRNYLVSDSVLLFLAVARGDSGPLDWLPPFGRQMDEFLFNYPMVSADRGSTTYALWFWLTNAFAKTAMVWLLVGLTWTLTRRRWVVPIAVAGLVLFMTPLAKPRDYVSLMGGQNPAIYLGHAGRHLGIVLPLLLLVVLSEGSRRWANVVCVGLGVSLMSTSVHNHLDTVVMSALAVLAVATARRVATRPHRRRLGARIAADGAGLVAVGAPLVAYWAIDAGHQGFRGIPLIVGATAAAAGIIWSGYALADAGPADPIADSGQGDPQEEEPLAPERIHPRRLIPLAAGAVLGALTMGNLFYDTLMQHRTYSSFMRTLFPAYEQTPLFLQKFVSHPFQLASCVNVPTPACGSLDGFLAYFGLTVAAAAGALVVVRCSKAPLATRRRDLALVLANVALFDIGVFLNNFMGSTDNGTYWIQTRFLEAGYYGIWIMLAVVMWNHLGRLTRWMGVATVSVWFIVPLLSHHFPRQWWANFKYLARIL